MHGAAGRSMMTAEFTRLRWRVTHPEPVVQPPRTSPIIADPTFLPASETPDGRWHLFAHSIWGVHHFVSHDGIGWTSAGLVVRHAMRAFLCHDGATYHLFYERYPPYRLALSWLPRLGWRSWIARRTSRDLVRWNDEVVVLRPELPWHRAPGLGEAVGNPCVLAVTSGCLLYYSAALVRVPDCGFNEPLHIGLARAATPDGPWQSHATPVLSPDPRDVRSNLGAGAIKVVPTDDGFVGFHNGIAFDRATGRSRSAISMRTSVDGLTWEYAHAEPIVAPTAGWRASHVYACDVRRDARSGRWLLYFNGRDVAALRRGREAIGFVVADR